MEIAIPIRRFNADILKTFKRIVRNKNKVIFIRQLGTNLNKVKLNTTKYTMDPRYTF